MAYGRYGPLRDEVPEEDTEWDLKGPNADPMEDFGISPPRASASWRRRKEDEYMEGVRRGLLGGTYVEQPRRSHLDFEEEMDVAAVGTQSGRRRDSRSTSRPAFMVSKVADAAVWKDLNNIRRPMYDGNPFNLDRFLEKLHDWGMTVTEDMDPAAAEKYVFKRL